MDFTRLLTSSTLVAFIAILLKLLGAPWHHAKKIARLTKAQDTIGALMFADMLLGYLVDGARLIAPGEDESVLLKRLDRLAAFARDFRSAVKDVVSTSNNIRLQIAFGDGLAFVRDAECAVLRDLFIAPVAHHNTS